MSDCTGDQSGAEPGLASRSRCAASREPLTAVVVELARLLERRMQQGLGIHDVSLSQAMALMSILRRPGISRADLARSLQVSPQAVGQLLTQLLERGLVARTPAGPGQRIQIELTDEGFRVLKLSRPLFDAMDRNLLRLFAPNFAEVMDKALRHALTKLDGE